MPLKPSVCIVAYNGIDGACAAAMALLARPKAEVVVSSARRIAQTLASLSSAGYGELHVCGVGIHCPWDDLAQPLIAIGKTKCAVYWHCGRGYLDERRAALEAHCHTGFHDASTNTAAMAEHFQCADEEAADRLCRLAQHDPNLATGARTPPDTREADWIDFIDAAVSHYVKYQDGEPYERAIRRLAAGLLEPEDRALIEMFRAQGYRHLLHGSTPAVRRLKERIKRCADADRHVLITGESGVGKEHVAHLLWERSARAMGPFMAVNCALYAGNAHLANSDLFGHKRGAFTGADRDRAGKFVEADGGILFLDELGELPLEVQAKLLRVLEDGRVMPEGADAYERTVDVRVIAATNRHLPTAIRAGAFRADLYHRIATLRIEAPPLRERLEDIPAIVAHRLDSLAREGHAREFTSRDLKSLRDYPWPGNVRQLLKIVDRAVILGMTLREAIDEERALGELMESGSGVNDAWRPQSVSDVRTMAEIQRAYAELAWRLHGHNYAATARALGVTQNTLRYTYLKAKR